MNPLDIVIIVVLSFFLIRGIFRGIIKEISSIVGVLAGFYAGYTYYMELGKLLSGWISNAGYRNIISFMIIFCLVWILVGILGVIIKYLLKIASLGWFDRILGAGFGVVKSVLFASVLVLILTTFLPKASPIVRHSLLAPHAMKISSKMVKVVPKEMKQEFFAKFNELRRIWNIP
jgi:membrane protein required for colicin V production